MTASLPSTGIRCCPAKSHSIDVPAVTGALLDGTRPAPLVGRRPGADELARARPAPAALRPDLGDGRHRRVELLRQPRRRPSVRLGRRRLLGHVRGRAAQRDGHGAHDRRPPASRGRGERFRERAGNTDDGRDRLRRQHPQGLLRHRRRHAQPGRPVPREGRREARRAREDGLRALRQRQRLLRHVLRRQLLPRPLPRDDEEQLLRDPLRLGRGRGAPARRPRGPVRAQASTTSARTSTRPCPSTSTRRTWRPCTASSRARSRPTAR